MIKRHFLRLICLSIVVLTLISSVFYLSISASEESIPPAVENVTSSCLYDKTHNRMIVNNNPDELLNTSTSAKVMTGLIACELLSGKLSERITITEKMLSGSSGYSMRLEVGEEISVNDLLYGAICGSYNDAAYVLASICAESVQGFVELMNDRARALGASSTSYTNPIGYPDNAAMVTTLADTLKIALAASDNELYMEISSTVKHTVSPTNKNDSRTVYNRNSLVSSKGETTYYNPKCKGMNAGISGDAGGWSIVTLAQDEGAEYICIVLGGKESEDGAQIYAYDAVNTLVNWACKTYNEHKVLDEGQILGVADVAMTALGTEKVRIAAASELSVYIADAYKSDISYEVEYVSDKLKAPLSAGDKVGTVRVRCSGENVGECDVIITEDCDVNIVMEVINVIGEYTKSRAFIATLICFAILLPIVLISKSRKNSRRKGYRKY